MKFSTALAPRGSRPGGSGRHATRPEKSTEGARRRDLVHAARVPRRAAQQPPHRQRRAREQAVHLEGLDGVGAAGRVEATRRRQDGRDPALVAAHERDERPRRPGRAGTRPRRRRSRPCPGPAQDRPQTGVEVVAQHGGRCVRRRRQRPNHQPGTRRAASPGARRGGGAACGRRGGAPPTRRRRGSPRDRRAADASARSGTAAGTRGGRPVEGGRRVDPGGRPR